MRLVRDATERDEPRGGDVMKNFVTAKEGSMRRGILALGTSVLVVGLCAMDTQAQQLELATHTSDSAPMAFYNKLRAFDLSGNVVQVENFQLQKDRVEMTFTGEFYLAEPIAGEVYGAVFVGKGHLSTEPWSLFEKENVKRFLKAETVEATFSKAVLRFTDDTYKRLAQNPPITGTARPQAQKLAVKLEQHLVRETGLNLSARLLVAVMNHDDPGAFFGEFDGGNWKRFCVLLDHQARVLGSVFGVNGGEKGLLFKYKGQVYGNDLWTAFYNQADFERGRVAYSDVFELVRIPNYRMEVDVRDPGDWLRMEVEMDLVPTVTGVRLIPMKLNEGLDEYDKERLKKGLRVLSAALADGTPVDVIQEDWETGFSLLFPRALIRDERVTLKLNLEGKDTLWTRGELHFPRSTTTWYPRHGYLARSRFDLKFRHKGKYRVVSVGQRLREGPVEDGSDEWFTHWVMEEPVALITFAVGHFERHQETADVPGQTIQLEFYSLPWATTQIPIYEEFLLAELSNSVRYFSRLFGAYPYGRLGGVYFPGPFGQGFPSMLLLPVGGYATTREFAFIAHEVAHQWWGNIVGWRSYRDQWLSEGFAEYSGALFTGWREKPKKVRDLVKEMRRSLKDPVFDDMGPRSGKLYEVGPLILGHRLSTRLTQNAYSTLIYNKGALVLRMIHFLLTDPDNGNDSAFFNMMKDFVEQHRNGDASTESFFEIASRHLANSPLGRRYKLKDLNWFMYQWVHQTALPSYELRYRFESRQDGGINLIGTLYQKDAPEDWFMLLPLEFQFPGKRSARAVIHAYGPETAVKLRLPERPRDVKLDPDMWVLSDKTSEKRGR